jgi:hypothetical protein
LKARKGRKPEKRASTKLAMISVRESNDRNMLGSVPPRIDINSNDSSTKIYDDHFRELMAVGFGKGKRYQMVSLQHFVERLRWL